MKPLHNVLIGCGIILLFVAWNYRYLFGKRGNVKMAKARSISSSSASAAAAVFDSEEEESGEMVLKEVLGLSHAAHVLTRSSALLNKILKQDRETACAILIRDYGLSSVMVLKKNDGGEGEEVEEGFKKMGEIMSKVEGEGGDKKLTTEVEKHKNDDISDQKNDHNPDHKNDHKNEHNVENHHHSTSDPLRIALYCRNVDRPPRIGRVVRMVDDYIVELVK